MTEGPPPPPYLGFSEYPAICDSTIYYAQIKRRIDFRQHAPRDEGAHIDPALFEKTIGPLLKIDNELLATSDEEDEN